jgi:hypothetical protein
MSVRTVLLIQMAVKLHNHTGKDTKQMHYMDCRYGLHSIDEAQLYVLRTRNYRRYFEW